MKSVLLILCLLIVTSAAVAQTYEINGQQPQPAPSSSQTPRQKIGQSNQANASGENGMGWGSSIEVGRLVRAAEDALRRGNPSAAADYAQRAVNAAISVAVMRELCTEVVGRTKRETSTCRSEG